MQESALSEETEKLGHEFDLFQEVIMNGDLLINKGEMPPLKGRERRLLILTACLDLDIAACNELKVLIQEGIDWEVVIRQGSMHGTIGILYRNLLKVDEKNLVPGNVMERMRGMYISITANNMKYLTLADSLVKYLAAAGIEIIFLKGADLQKSLYRDYGLRAMSDIDILIRENDWPVMRQTLKEQGYRSAEEDFDEIPPKLSKYDVKAHIQYVSDSGNCLEFQFDLYTLGIGMKDIDSVWSRSKPLPEDTDGLRALSAEDQLLQLIVHANRHGLSRLKWLVDIAELMRQDNEINWGLLVEIARKEKIEAVVYHVLDYIEELYQYRFVPQRVMNKLRPQLYKSIIWRKVWPRKTINRFNGRNEDVITFYFYRPFCIWNLLNYLLMGRSLDKIYYQIRWIMPPMKWMAATYKMPESLGLLKYYPKRVVNYSRRKSKTGL